MMNQKEFIMLSEHNTLKLNGSNIEESFEAWRDGYLTAKSEVENIYKNSEDYDDFIIKIEQFIDQKLNYFK